MSAREERIEAREAREEFAYFHDDGHARRRDQTRRADLLVAEHGLGLHDVGSSLGCFACELAIAADEREDEDMRYETAG